MGELGHDVAAAVARERLEQPRRERFEVGAHGVDARLGEERVDERAIPGVLRRVELDREQRVRARLRGRDERRAGDGRAERLVIDRRGRHVVIAREQPEAAVQVRVQERMLLPDRPEDALGIPDEARVVVVEAHAAPGRICERPRPSRGGCPRRSSHAPRSGSGIVLRPGRERRSAGCLQIGRRRWLRPRVSFGASATRVRAWGPEGDLDVRRGG